MSSSALTPGQQSKFDAQKTMKLIIATTKRALKHKKEADELILLLSPRKPRAKLGHISEKIYGSGPSSVQNNSSFADVPAELMHMMVSYLSVAERACFALSCKQYAAVVESVKAKETVDRPKRPGTKEQKLQVLMAIENWMPKNLKLCCLCLVYMPKAELKLDKTDSRTEEGGWGGDSKLLKRGKVTAKWIFVGGPRCPTCVKREQMAMMKTRKEYRQLAKAVSANGKVRFSKARR